MYSFSRRGVGAHSGSEMACLRKSVITARPSECEEGDVTESTVVTSTPSALTAPEGPTTQRDTPQSSTTTRGQVNTQTPGERPSVVELTVGVARTQGIVLVVSVGNCVMGMFTRQSNPRQWLRKNDRKRSVQNKKTCVLNVCIFISQRKTTINLIGRRGYLIPCTPPPPQKYIFNWCH